MIIDDKLLNEVAAQAVVNPRLRMNYNLHDSLESKAQRLLNALEPGTELPVHRHLHTSETYILVRGCIDVIFYDDVGNEVERYNLNPQNGKYGIHIPTGCWHTLYVHEPSVIFEVKDGPYIPLTPDNVLVK